MSADRTPQSPQSSEQVTLHDLREPTGVHCPGCGWSSGGHDPDCAVERYVDYRLSLVQARYDEYVRVGGEPDLLPMTLVEAERSGFLSGLRSAVDTMRFGAERRFRASKDGGEG